MKSFFSILISLLISTILIGFFLSNKPGTAPEGRQSLSPCSEPLTIMVGDIDDRFRMSEEEIKSIINSVTEAWSDAAGFPVAVYSESGDIKVHLVYDEQQMLTDRERQFRNRLQMKEYQIKDLEHEYQEDVKNFEEWNRVYQRESEELEGVMNQLNDWIQQINSEGGFTREQLDTLEERRERVDMLTDRLDQSGTILTGKADDINRKLRQINQMIEEKNDLIREYNQTFTGTRRFTQGSYERSGNRKWINVFQFANSEELELVIAHEVGHALGLEHVDDPASVMHELMGQQVRTELVLTEEDKKALQEVCGNS